MRLRRKANPHRIGQARFEDAMQPWLARTGLVFDAIDDGFRTGRVHDLGVLRARLIAVAGAALAGEKMLGEIHQRRRDAGATVPARIILDGTPASGTRSV